MTVVGQEMTFSVSPPYKGELCVTKRFRNFVILSASEGSRLFFRFIEVEEKSRFFSSRRRRRSFRMTMCAVLRWLRKGLFAKDG
jgi:hypothetical protein